MKGGYIKSSNDGNKKHVESTPDAPSNLLHLQVIFEATPHMESCQKKLENPWGIGGAHPLNTNLPK